MRSFSFKNIFLAVSKLFESKAKGKESKASWLLGD